MRKQFFLSFTVLCLGFSHFTAAHETALKKELLAIDELASDYMGNGWSDVIELEQKPFNQKQQIAILNRSVKEHSDCKMKIVAGRRANLKTLYSPDVSYEKKLPDAIYKLYRQGKIRSIISKQWDQKSGEGVYCGIYSFRIFSTDGHVLRLHMELTD